MKVTRYKAGCAAVMAAGLAGTPALAQDPIDTIRPDAPELAAYGDWPVGVRSLTIAREDVPDVPAVMAMEAPEGGPEEAPLTTRSLTVEVWYPAAEGTQAGTTYETVLRDGTTPVTLSGRAARDAGAASGESFPLVLVSHGYPGNRFLLSPLAENLASKGYVVASIDHPDSTYSDQGAFASTLVNRPWDQQAVLDGMAALDGDLGAITDGETAAIIGYSMGGYGALIFAGAGVSEAALDSGYAPPMELLAVNRAGTPGFAALRDDRLKAAVAFGPWGRNTDFWDAEGLAGIEIPLLILAGSADATSGYPAIRAIFEETTGTRRQLLTFENAGHNAGAPMPAPSAAWGEFPDMDWLPFTHYADPVWDTVRMNNIAQHMVTAFLDLHLKGDTGKAAYLDLVPEQPVEGQSGEYWDGFAGGEAPGLRLETREAGE
ncbi:alpha/beta hydrolase family protein [Pseudoroseicyclus aestuarii]|uniref:Putative dienelactone hydrolase n=1 Tax=Pseudoroseicyclus aestuarii TaxID=1795041 RepID=A0A318SZC7_9RHOB|nr:alpha/beta fold hydrolase [Pseudoroseicyclus aestuarii]PYE85766.1 putative dienelactone hydrolase [Pseudoroseicyclus aestuarii]